MLTILEIIEYKNKISSFKIIISSYENPLFLIILELSENEFTNISEEQKILITFENFGNYFLNLLNLCKKDKYISNLFVTESPTVDLIIE